MNAHKQLHLATRPRWLFLIGILSLVVWMLWPDNDNRQALHPPVIAATTSQPCIEVRPQTATHQDAVVKKPGQHCVVSDFWQRNLSGAGHNWPGAYHHLMGVWSSNVIIDLMNHTLRADSASSGIVIYFDGFNSKELPSNSARNITIKNGVIDLRGSGAAVADLYEWQLDMIDEVIPDKLKGYEKTNITLENLLIKVNRTSIALEGDGNIIRNCIIESGGNSAITLAGPNGKIINNTIILTDPFFPQWFSSGKYTDNEFTRFFEARHINRAAIVLHQGTGSIISGNRIEVKGKSPTRHNIYLTDASENVRIEGNTFVGAEDPVTLVKGSTATMKNNAFEQRKAPWWKPASENVRIEGNTFVGAEDPVTLVKGSTATIKNNVFEQRVPWWKF